MLPVILYWCGQFLAHARSFFKDFHLHINPLHFSGMLSVLLQFIPCKNVDTLRKIGWNSQQPRSEIIHVSWLFFFRLFHSEDVVCLLIVCQKPICLSHCLSSVHPSHVLFMERQASLTLSITFFCGSDHSLMLSYNFTLNSCSYRRPSICN